jgi:hypothetical protein
MASTVSVLKERKRDAEGKFVHCGKMYEDAQHVNHQVMRSSVPYIDQVGSTISRMGIR